MSVKINWLYSNLSDVSTVVICRSPVLNNEKAFEDALNGIANLANYPTILETINKNSISGNLQSYVDTQPLNYNTTYYYCIAVLGTGSNAQYKVGPTEAGASSTVITNSGDGNSSVAGFNTGSPAAAADLFTLMGINYLNYAGTAVDRSNLASDQNEIDDMLYDFEDALNWLRRFVSLPPGGLSHRITLNISEGFGANSLALAATQSSSPYTTSSAHTSQPFPFGQSFTRDGDITFNAPLSIEQRYKEFPDYNAAMDPLDPNYYFQTMVHELIHVMGMNGNVMDISNIYTSNAPISSSGESEIGYLFRGTQATKEYRRYIAKVNDISVLEASDVIGVPFENYGNTETAILNYHWEETKGVRDTAVTTPNRVINGRELYAPAYDVISSAKSILPYRWENTDTNTGKLYYRSAAYTTRLTLSMLEDVGYIIDWDEFEVLACDTNPCSGDCMPLTSYPYPS